MKLRMWMLDVAREQTSRVDLLMRYAKLSQDAGFDALGLYLEHRFAYPSAPWAQGAGCVTPDMIRQVRSEFPSLQIVPFINLLGHFEGMLYTEEGKQYREALFEGMQACPSNPDFVQFCGRLVDDTLQAFDSEIIHIGGDETWQLATCPTCKQKSRARLYGDHFVPLAERVIKAGRRPAVWGDMFLDHPSALDDLPRETLVFDWQYFQGIKKTSTLFAERGLEVVGSPTIHVYNATWAHLEQSEKNVREVAADVEELGYHGVCVTTWESGLFGSYDTLFPAIRACGKILNGQNATFLGEYDAESKAHGEWARMMSVELQSLGGVFAFSGIRSSLKARFLLYSNPFLAWMHLGEELSGEVGEKALALFERALKVAPTEAEKGVTLFARGAVEFVRLAEEAHKLYAAGKPEEAIGKLAATRMIFDDLAKVAKRSAERIGGSLADVERCRVAKAHVEMVIARLRDYGHRELGYLPAFEVITHPKFVPHDQACWWLINRWANQ